MSWLIWQCRGVYYAFELNGEIFDATLEPERELTPDAAASVAQSMVGVGM